MYNKVDNKTWQRDAFMDDKLILKNNLKQIRTEKAFHRHSLHKQSVFPEIQSVLLKRVSSTLPQNLLWFYAFHWTKNLKTCFTLIKYPIGCLFFALPQVKMNICIEYSLKYTFYAKSSVKNEYSLFLHICIFIHILKIYAEIKVDFAVKTLGFILN